MLSRHGWESSRGDSALLSTSIARAVLIKRRKNTPAKFILLDEESRRALQLGNRSAGSSRLGSSERLQSKLDNLDNAWSAIARANTATMSTRQPRYAHSALRPPTPPLRFSRAVFR